MVYLLNYQHKPFFKMQIAEYKFSNITSMKKTFLFFMLIAAFASVLYSGCEPVDEDTSGDPRDQYVGEWQFIESFKSTESQSYLVTISLDPNNSSQVIIGNLGNPGDQDITVKGTVTSGKIIVSSQNMGNGWVIEGAGQMNNVAKTSMLWTYSITAGGNQDDYNATATLN
jgi:hypothetical protein